LVAPFPHPVAKAGIRERLAVAGHKESHDPVRRDPDRFGEGAYRLVNLADDRVAGFVEASLYL
jgi:hypothetical protein